MAISMLQSLVLRGVAVRLGAPGYLRLGRGVQANGQVPGIPNSLQPLPGKRPDAPDVVEATKGASPGAGRSRRHAASPCRGKTAITPAAHSWRGIFAAPVMRRGERSR
jgi:hypothetical protein